MPKSLAIIGGGPIGLFLALKLAKIGHQVSLFEKGTWPLDKVCGQGIMPSGLKLLREIGVDLKAKNDHFFFSGIEYIDYEQQLIGRFQSQALGIERSILSEKLFQVARQQPNLNLFPDHKFLDIEEVKGKINLQFEAKSMSHSYDYVFACDGLNSISRKILKMDKPRQSARRMGARSHYIISPWSDKVQVYWQEGVEAYVTPVHSNRVEVAFLWYENEMEKGAELKERLFNKFPALNDKLKNSAPIDDFRAYGPFQNTAKTMRKGNVFFVGDAYKFLDGITGEGLSLGMKAASILAENFETMDYMSKLKIKALYFNYAFWVRLALLLSRKKYFRGLLFKFLNYFPPLFNIVLRLNDLSFKGRDRSKEASLSSSLR